MEKQTCYQRTGQTPAEVNKTTAVVSDDELFEKIDDFFVCLIYGEIDENDAFFGFSDAEIERIKKLAESGEPHAQAILAMSDDNADIEALIESAEKKKKIMIWHKFLLFIFVVVLTMIMTNI